MNAEKMPIHEQKQLQSSAWQDVPGLSGKGAAVKPLDKRRKVMEYAMVP